MKDIKALAKSLVKQDILMSKAHRLHAKKRARILKRAIALDGKLLDALSNTFKTLDTKAIEKASQRLISDMYEAMNKRLGRVLQKAVPRRERRFKLREAAK